MQIKYKLDDGPERAFDVPAGYDNAAGATVAGLIIDHEMEARGIGVDDPGTWPESIVIIRGGRVTRHAVSIEPPPRCLM